MASNSNPYAAGIAQLLTNPDAHNPQRYGGGFYGGFMSVVGPHADALEYDELAQRQFERQKFYEMMTDPELAIQPSDTPEVQDAKRRQLQWASDEYAKRSGKQNKGLLQKLLPFLQRLHGHDQPGQEQQAQGPAGAAATPASRTSASVPMPPTAAAASSAMAAAAPVTGAAPAAPPAAPMSEQLGAPAGMIPPPPTMADVNATIEHGRLAHGAEAERLKNATDLAAHQATQQSDYEFQMQHSPVKLAYDQLKSTFPDMPEEDLRRNALIASKMAMMGRSVAAWGMGPDGQLIPMQQVGNELLPMNNPTGVPLVSKTSSTTKTAWGKDAKGFYQAKLNPATNQMIPATKNYDVLPPAAYMEHIKQGYYYYTDEQGALHQVPVTTTTSVGGASGGGRSRTTVPEPPSASLGASSAPAAPVAAVVSQAASQGDHILGHKGPTGQTKSRADAAAAIVPLISHVRQMLGDIPPEEYAAASDAYKKAVEDTKDYEGPASGRIALMEKRIGNLPRKARELAGTLISIYSLAGTMHGWRALKVAEEFEKTYGGLEASPDSLLGGMDAMANTAHEIYKAGYHHDIGEAPGGGGSSVIYARDPQGKLHKAPAGTAIPKGWKVENAPTVH